MYQTDTYYAVQIGPLLCYIGESTFILVLLEMRLIDGVDGMDVVDGIDVVEAITVVVVVEHGLCYGPVLVVGCVGQHGAHHGNAD